MSEQPAEMAATRYVWVWESPDGPILFGARTRAMAYVEKCFPGGTWDHSGEHVWCYEPPADDTVTLWRTELL